MHSAMATETVATAWLRLVAAVPGGHAVCAMNGHSLSAVTPHSSAASARAHAATLAPGAVQVGPDPYKLWFLGSSSFQLVSEHPTRAAADRACADAYVVLRCSGPHR